MSASADAIAKAYLQAPNVEDVSIGEHIKGRCVRWEVGGTTGEWACVDMPTYRLAKERMHVWETRAWTSPDIVAVPAGYGAVAERMGRARADDDELRAAARTSTDAREELMQARQAERTRQAAVWAARSGSTRYVERTPWWRAGRGCSVEKYAQWKAAAKPNYIWEVGAFIAVEEEWAPKYKDPRREPGSQVRVMYIDEWAASAQGSRGRGLGGGRRVMRHAVMQAAANGCEELHLLVRMEAPQRYAREIYTEIGMSSAKRARGHVDGVTVPDGAEYWIGDVMVACEAVGAWELPDRADVDIQAYPSAGAYESTAGKGGGIQAVYKEAHEAAGDGQCWEEDHRQEAQHIVLEVRRECEEEW